jgi:hypothetical protein
VKVEKISSDAFRELGPVKRWSTVLLYWITCTKIDFKRFDCVSAPRKMHRCADQRRRLAGNELGSQIRRQVTKKMFGPLDLRQFNWHYNSHEMALSQITRQSVCQDEFMKKSPKM